MTERLPGIAIIFNKIKNELAPVILALTTVIGAQAISACTEEGDEVTVNNYFGDGYNPNDPNGSPSYTDTSVDSNNYHDTGNNYQDTGYNQNDTGTDTQSDSDFDPREWSNPPEFDPDHLPEYPNNHPIFYFFEVLKAIENVDGYDLDFSSVLAYICHYHQIIHDEDLYPVFDYQERYEFELPVEDFFKRVVDRSNELLDDESLWDENLIGAPNEEQLRCDARQAIIQIKNAAHNAYLDQVAWTTESLATTAARTYRKGRDDLEDIYSECE